MNTHSPSTRIAISAEETLNAVVARYPQALPVLSQFGLGTCCGGALSLRMAARHHDLDLDALLAALQAAVQEGRR